MQFKTIVFEELKTSKMQYYHPLQIIHKNSLPVKTNVKLDSVNACHVCIYYTELHGGKHFILLLQHSMLQGFFLATVPSSNSFVLIFYHWREQTGDISPRSPEVSFLIYALYSLYYNLPHPLPRLLPSHACQYILIDVY